MVAFAIGIFLDPTSADGFLIKGGFLLPSLEFFLTIFIIFTWVILIPLTVLPHIKGKKEMISKFFKLQAPLVLFALVLLAFFAFWSLMAAQIMLAGFLMIGIVTVAVSNPLMFVYFIFTYIVRSASILTSDIKSKIISWMRLWASLPLLVVSMLFSAVLGDIYLTNYGYASWDVLCESAGIALERCVSGTSPIVPVLWLITYFILSMFLEVLAEALDYFITKNYPNTLIPK